MKKRELLALLKALIVALAEQETPPPKPQAPVPTTPRGASLRYTGNKIEVMGPDGQWHPASFVPMGYRQDDDGYWRP